MTGDDRPNGGGGTADVDALLVRHLPRLRAFVRLRTNALVREHESCSDLLQSVCREVLAGARDFRYQGEPAFRSWLFRTALNKILERTRHLTRGKRDVRRERRGDPGVDYGELMTNDPTASQLAAAAELRDRLEWAFDRLPDDYRQVITDSRLMGLTHAEIAAEMGRSEGAVRVLLSRALVALTAVLDRREP